MIKRIFLASAIALVCSYPMLAAANDSDEITRLNFELTRAKQELDSTSSQIAELEKKLKHEKQH